MDLCNATAIDEGLLEIKYPFTYRGLSIKDYAATDDCLEIIDYRFLLKRTHFFFSPSAMPNWGHRKEMV